MNLEKYSKVLFFASGVVLILAGVPMVFLGGGIPYLSYLLWVALGLFAMGSILSYKSLIAFFTMRTTKYGLNMGTLVGLAIILYVCLNFFAFRYDKSVDITGDQINSLSLQSLEILDGLTEPVEFVVYYQGKIHSSQNMGLKDFFKKYKRESSKTTSRFIDAHKDPSAAEHLTREDKGKIVIFAKQGQAMERVREPIDEESLTSALFRLNRVELKTIYFLQGHGERPLQANESDGSGLSKLSEALRSKGQKVKTLNLMSTKKVPDDAALVAIIGPKKELLTEEVELIKDYVVDGGSLILASDPSSEENLGRITELLGVQASGDFLLVTQTIAGGDALSVLGQNFSSKSKITEQFDQGTLTIFYESSSLETTAVSGVSVDEIVKTEPVVIPVKSLKTYKEEIKGKSPQTATVGVLATGSLEEGAHEGHDHGPDLDESFSVAIFSDSDFMSDIYFGTVFNRDLALNTFAELAGKENLISIRPRTAQDTKLILTTSRSAFVVILPILLPLMLLIASSMLWFRKRGA